VTRFSTKEKSGIQISGRTMKKFEGKWIVEPQTDGTTKVHLDVDFELAMPALRDFLGPMAKKIMRDSLKSLLQGIKAESERV